MVRFLIRRITSAVPVALFVMFLIFILMRLVPGDPVIAMYGETEMLTPEMRAALRHELGLDQPLHIQFTAWFARVIRLDLGRSLRNRQPVREALRQRLPETLELASFALLATLVLALPLGVVSAVRPGSVGDWCGTLFSLVGASMPYFLLGTLLVYVVALVLRWLPPSGYIDLLQDPLGNLKLMILPAMTIGTAQAALVARILRSELVEVLHQDYVRTAHAKGLSEPAVILKHGLKNAMLPVLTVLGAQIVGLFGGAVITEAIFALPGIGTLLVDAIYARDYPIVQGVVLIMALMILLTNIIVDILYSHVDPRIHYGS